MSGCGPGPGADEIGVGDESCLEAPTKLSGGLVTERLQGHKGDGDAIYWPLGSLGWSSSGPWT